jgi:hypothetical protein
MYSCADNSTSSYYYPYCRSWFYNQYKANSCKFSHLLIQDVDTTFGDLYNFANSPNYGVTHCVPINNKDKFIGALCNDLIPTSTTKGSSFIQNNYNPEYEINYLFFSKDDKYVSFKVGQILILIRKVETIPYCRHGYKALCIIKGIYQSLPWITIPYKMGYRFSREILLLKILTRKCKV